MTHTELIDAPRRWVKNQTWILGICLFYFAAMFLFYPFRTAFWLDHDEGIELSKAMLVLRGDHLYTRIWDDQPPVLTYLLTGVFRLFGLRINLARTLVLVLACGLIWASLNYLLIVWGGWHVVGGVFMLWLLPRFTDLSVSVMNAIPVLTFALFSLLTLTYWHKQTKYYWLFLSAGFLALSVLTKLFTAFLAIVFLVGLVVEEYNHRQATSMRRAWWRPAVIWGISFSLFLVIAVLLLIGVANLQQLYTGNLIANRLEVYRSDPVYSLTWQLRQAQPVLILSLLGVWYSLLRKRWLSLYIVAWMGMAYLLLFRHVPAWSHQQLLITIPAAILAAAAFGEGLKGAYARLRQPIRVTWGDSTHLLSIAIFLYILVTSAPATLSEFSPYPIFQNPGITTTSAEAQTLKEIRRYTPEAHLLVTDLPIYAFYADIPIPPNLAVFSSKRLETGQLTEAEVLTTIQKNQPELVLFGRFDFPTIRAYLQKQYRLINERQGGYLYVLKGLMPSKTP
jgi:4-amino-4-deoxy-L-arabinose transferase-like glycosyltransferase